jgi:predicted GNAT superfamily acetyltransferase
MSARLRDATEADFDRIVGLNAAESEMTSPMDRARLAQLHALACYHRVAELDDRVVAFLLAMRDGAAYRNDNFEWHAARATAFVYVDRIVVDAGASGRGIGGALYRDLFGFSRAVGVPVVACEFNLDPPNPASAAFHVRHGFVEVGQRVYPDGSKRVSMQVARP